MDIERFGAKEKKERVSLVDAVITLVASSVGGVGIGLFVGALLGLVSAIVIGVHASFVTRTIDFTKIPLVLFSVLPLMFIGAVSALKLGFAIGVLCGFTFLISERITVGIIIGIVSSGISICFFPMKIFGVKSADVDFITICLAIMAGASIGWGLFRLLYNMSNRDSGTES